MAEQSSQEERQLTMYILCARRALDLFEKESDLAIGHLHRIEAAADILDGVEGIIQDKLDEPYVTEADELHGRDDTSEQAGGESGVSSRSVGLAGLACAKCGAWLGAPHRDGCDR